MGEHGLACSELIFEISTFSWQKSSYSAYNGACVGVAPVQEGLIGVRDLKEGLSGDRILFVSKSAWAAFLADVKKL